jgi:hypothetical protein
VKLFNRTAVDDKTIKKVLREAARGLGVRTSGVGIVVRTSRYQTNGMAYMCSRFWSAKGWVYTDRGMFKIWLPMCLGENPLHCAERFYSTARHEWAHLKDYQDQGGQRIRPHSKRVNGRRPNHDSRPEELRACNFVDQADKKIKRDDSILTELARAIQMVSLLRALKRQRGAVERPGHGPFPEEDAP